MTQMIKGEEGLIETIKIKGLLYTGYTGERRQKLQEACIAEDLLKKSTGLKPAVL